MSVQIVMSSAPEMLLPKGESNEKKKTKPACDPVGMEEKGMLAGINILQNWWEVPNMNFS